MSTDKRVKKYFENMPYGETAVSSEIHGKDNQEIINGFIVSLVGKYDKYIAEGDKGMAKHFKDAIYQISRDLNNLREIKKEFAVNYGGGTGGKNLFSNYTNLNFDRAFMIEQGRISFNEALRPVLSVMTPDGEVSKNIEDITENWVVKGDEENQYMKMQQDAAKQRNTVGQPLDFDIDWAVDNLLVNNDAWKVFATDKIGGRYFLHDYLQENQEALNTGQIPDEMLHPDSFNPDFDTRLHKYYSNRLKKAFDPNHQTLQEKQEAEELMARTNSPTQKKTDGVIHLDTPHHHKHER